MHVEVQGLEDPELVEVWVVDNRSGPGRTAQPEIGDRFVGCGHLEPAEGLWTLSSTVRDLLNDFEIDAVVISRAGETPAESCALVGLTSLFQRKYSRARQQEVTTATEQPSLDDLVVRGADLFFNETFEGNGRTCGTCHPAENNLTIDAEFIAQLPRDDPLFVAETEPALRKNFEIPVLMRGLGLILENGFVMRGVPHLFAMKTSKSAPLGGEDGTTFPPQDRLGWSGDGAPGSGTLREFAAGAIRQHFPRTLTRHAGSDFRFATDEELDALEAFQLFLGRDQDIADVGLLEFSSPLVARGRDIFMATDTQGSTVVAGKCQLCHVNAGATALVSPGNNLNFNTGAEDLPDHPADLLGRENHPRDGGFGVSLNGKGGLGNVTFNTPPLVEAADTGPFFHNNAVETIEDAVNFYNSRAFNESAAARDIVDPSTGVAIRLEATQVHAVAAFLRALNALENLRSASEFLRAAEFGDSEATARVALLRRARFDVEDAREVLSGGGIHPGVARRLKDIERKLDVAIFTEDEDLRSEIIFEAIENLRVARDAILAL